MSRDLILTLFRAIDSCDWTRLIDVFHADVTYERPGYEPFTGINRLLHFYREERIISSGTHHIEHIVVEDGCGASWGRIIGTSKDGDEINESFSDVYVFQDGKIRKRRSYFYRPCV